MLFGITNRTSFESVTQWHWEVLEKVKPFNILFLVVAIRETWCLATGDAGGRGEAGCLSGRSLC